MKNVPMYCLDSSLKFLQTIFSNRQSDIKNKAESTEKKHYSIN